MTSDLSVREQIARYTSNDISLDALAAWLDEAALDCDEAVLFDALRLLSEHENGDRTAEDLRDHLEVMNGIYWRAPGVAYASTDQHVVIRQDRRARPIERRRVAESV